MTDYFYMVSMNDFKAHNNYQEIINGGLIDASRAFEESLDGTNLPSELSAAVLENISAAGNDLIAFEDKQCVAYGYLDETYNYLIYPMMDQPCFQISAEERVEYIRKLANNDFENNVIVDGNGKLVRWDVFFNKLQNS